MSRQSLLRGVMIALWLVGAAAFILWFDPGATDSTPEAARYYERAVDFREKGEPDRAHEAVERALRVDSGNVSYRSLKGHLELQMEVPEQAIETLRPAASGPGRSLDATFGLAEAFLKVGQADSTRGVLMSTVGALVRGDSLRTEVRPEQVRRRAQLWARAGESERALRDLTFLLRRRPENAELLGEAAAHAAAIGKWDQALSLSRRLVSAADGETAKREALRLQAQAHRARGRPDVAYEVYTKIANPQNLEQRASLAFELKRYGEAADLYRRLAQSTPKHPEYRQRLAFALDRSGRELEAERQYRALLSSGVARDTDRVRYAHFLNERNRYDEAWRLLAALPCPAGNSALHRLQANTAFWAAQTADAAALLRSSAARGSAGPDELRRLGLVEWHMNHRREAASRLRRAVRKAKTAPRDLLLNLGRLYRQTARPDSATVWYQRYLDTSPPSEERRVALFELAQVHYDAGAFQKALERLRPLLERDPAAPDHLLLAARAATGAGVPEGAIRYLDRLSAREPLSREQRAWLAAQHRAAGNTNQALEIYEELYAQGDPPDPAVAEATADLRVEVRNDHLRALSIYRELHERQRRGPSGTPDSGPARTKPPEEAAGSVKRTSQRTEAPYPFPTADSLHVEVYSTTKKGAAEDFLQSLQKWWASDRPEAAAALVEEGILSERLSTQVERARPYWRVHVGSFSTYEAARKAREVLDSHYEGAYVAHLLSDSERAPRCRGGFRPGEPTVAEVRARDTTQLHPAEVHNRKEEAMDGTRSGENGALTLKIARTAANADQDSLALAYYQSFIQSHPKRADSLGVPQELARYHLALGRLEDAAHWADRASRRDTSITRRDTSVTRRDTSVTGYVGHWGSGRGRLRGIPPEFGPSVLGRASTRGRAPLGAGRPRLSFGWPRYGTGNPPFEGRNSAPAG